MNLAVRIVMIALLGSACQVYFPWWSAVVVAFVVEALLGKGNTTAFFAGFYGIAVPWMILATYIDITSGSVLTVRIAELFSLPPYSFLLIIATGLVGGLVTGIGSMAGGWLKVAILKTDG